MVPNPYVPASVDTGHLLTLGRQAGLVAVGVTSADPFDDVRRILEQRRAQGLSADMQFTYRNPQRSTEPDRHLPGARSLVVGAWPYPGGSASEPGGIGPGRPQGSVARYARCDHYGDLRAALGVMAAHLSQAGWSTRILSDDNALVDRAAAHRAGLGWFGKNANLLVRGHGSWVVLGAVLTDADLTAAPGPEPDGCGACQRCIDSCPTGAIVAPGVVDARRCLAWLVQAPGVIPFEFRVPLGDRIYGCDDCQEVCPPSRRTGGHDTHGPSGTVDLISMLDATDDELLGRHGRWYIADRNPSYLRRNALVALANVASPTDPDTERVVRTHLAHPDAVVRAHAVWAARRLGRGDLCEVVEGADDPLVAAELAGPQPPPR